VLTLAIRDVLPATPRARILRLDLDGHVFDYVAGQAIRIGSHGGEIRKPYSISAAPEDARRSSSIELLVGVDENGIAGSHLSLGPGELVDVEGPLGTFTFPANPHEPRFIFIAGGTGIAPLRAMLRHALAIPHRNIGLFYSARTPDEFAYEEELRSLARERQIELRQTVTRSTGPDWAAHAGESAGVPFKNSYTIPKRCASSAGRRLSLTRCPSCSRSSASRERASGLTSGRERRVRD